MSTSATPLGINEFLGLGTLDDWAPVALYDPDEREECFNMFILVRARPAAAGQPGPHPSLHSALIIEDDHGRIGFVALPLTLPQLLTALASEEDTEDVLSPYHAAFNYG